MHSDALVFDALVFDPLGVEYGVFSDSVGNSSLLNH